MLGRYGGFKGHGADAYATWWAALKASEMTG